MKTKTLFSLEHTIAGEYLLKFEHPWEALSGIKDFIVELGNAFKPAALSH